MGIIVDANSDHDANDTYALVSDGVVVNMIVASYNFVNENILNNYDYMVDVTVGAQTAEIGYLYDAENDTFAMPEEEVDAIAALQASIEQIVDDIAIALDNSGGMSSEDIQSALDAAEGDEESGFSENEAALYAAISAYILAGG